MFSILTWVIVICKCNNEANEESNDTDVKIVGCSNNGRSTQSSSMDNVLINSNETKGCTFLQTILFVSLLSISKVPKILHKSFQNANWLKLRIPVVNKCIQELLPTYDPKAYEAGKTVLRWTIFYF